MLNNFIYAKQKSLFEEALNSDEVLDEAVVFIADTKEIWNHGTYFDCSTFDPSEIENTLTNKVDKVSGKQLSTEDFTTTLKTRLEGLNIYKKTYRQLQSLPSESSGWYTIAKVDDTESSLFQVSTGGHSDVTFTVSTGWGGNPGGSLTILNSFYSNDTGDINGNHVHIKQVRIRKYNNKLHIDLDLNKPISNASNYVNVVVSAFTNAGHDLLENELVLSDSQGTVVQTFELQNQAIMADKVVTKTITADNLATVATSGNYNDLSNKPTIPAAQVNADWNATSGKAQILNKPTIPNAVTESTVSGWGFTKNAGTYSKPSGGIPKSDLASAVQTSLGKADTALQSHQDISGKQDKLISGTNIKTINNTSILGSGNITIQGGSGGIPEVIDKEIYYNDGSNKVVPIKHPDISTQPSILPYKFMGQYVYEQLIPNPEGGALYIDTNDLIGTNQIILEAHLFGTFGYSACSVYRDVYNDNLNIFVISADHTVGGAPSHADYQYYRIVYTSTPEEGGDYYGYNNY